ncbi:hypothetical protein ACVWZK_007192 [Bradyrhizobium sp. GM0.4]
MPIHGLVRSPQRSKTIDVVRSRQLRRPYTLFVPAARQRATVGSPPGLTSAPALSACLADEARLEIGGPYLVRLLVDDIDDVAAQDDVVGLALCRQKTMRPRTPAARISPSVIFTGRPPGKLRFSWRAGLRILRSKPPAATLANYR